MNPTIPPELIESLRAIGAAMVEMVGRVVEEMTPAIEAFARTLSKEERARLLGETDPVTDPDQGR